MKKIVTLGILFCSMISIAQEKETPVAQEKKSSWKKDGLFTTLFNQSAYNKDWQAGGVNNIATNFKINYDINYAKGDVVWDNKIILAYGLAKTGDNNKFQKTNDRILITSLWGKKIKKKLVLFCLCKFKISICQWIYRQNRN